MHLLVQYTEAFKKTFTLRYHMWQLKDQSVFSLLCTIVLLCLCSGPSSTWGQYCTACVLQHTLSFHCNLVQNAHVTIATADPIIPAPFESGLASDASGCQISTLLLHPNCAVLIIKYNRKPYFTMTD